MPTSGRQVGDSRQQSTEYRANRPKAGCLPFAETCRWTGLQRGMKAILGGKVRPIPPAKLTAMYSDNGRQSHHWRRRELNPRPDTAPNKRLRVYPIL